MKFNYDNKESVFIHIPRTAGTYVEDNISQKFNTIKVWPTPNTETLFGLLKLNDYHFLTLQHLTLKEMVKFGFLNDKNTELFTIVRNPYDRVISLHKNWFSKYKTLDEFLDKLITMELDNYPFNGIVTKKENFNYLNMADNIDDIKYFVLPQYYYIAQDNNDYNVDVIKYENMEQLNNKYGINLKYNTTQNNYIFTKTQREKIYKIYKKDFEHFEYER
jgi:hypothetical protein